MEIEKKLGTELDFDARLEGDNIVLSFNHEGKLGFAKLETGVKAYQLIDKITDLIPGEWDDALIDDLAKKLLTKKTGE